MSTDYIDRDLIPRKPRGPRAGADPSTAELREAQAADLRADQERLASLEREAAVTQELIEKQEAYEAERAELTDALDAAQQRIADEKNHANALLEALDDAKRDLTASQRLIDNLHDDQWTDATRGPELDHALATLDDVRAHYNDVAKRLQEAASPAAGAGDAFLDASNAPSGHGFLSFIRSPHARAGWAWALGAALPLAGVLLALSVCWWLFLVLWW